MTEGWSCTKNSTRMSKSCNDLSGTSTMCVSQYQCVCLLANVRKEKKHLSFIKHLSQTGDHKGLHILESNKTARVMATPPARSQREAAEAPGVLSASRNTKKIKLQGARACGQLSTPFMIMHVEKLSTYAVCESFSFNFLF